MILAGDIGGTKTLLALFERADQALRPLHEASFPCAQYPSLEAVVRAFFADRPGGGPPPPIEAACFGVAGPVTGGSAKITNLPWTIDAARLAEELGGAKVELLNDLQATALGMLTLPEQSFAVLQPAAAPAPRDATIAVIAPGTGLGESMLVAFDGRYHALPSEGGHADFAPTGEDQIALWRFLSRRFGGHVSVERVLSGAGLGDLYEHVRIGAGEPEPSWLTSKPASERIAAISQAGLRRTDDNAARALELFVRILGAEAGNLALRGLAAGGVRLGGGIPPKILPALQSDLFLEEFRAKGRFAPWLATLEVKVALEPRAALLGAAHRASRAVG